MEEINKKLDTILSNQQVIYYMLLQLVESDKNSFLEDYAANLLATRTELSLLKDRK